MNAWFPVASFFDHVAHVAKIGIGESATWSGEIFTCHVAGMSLSPNIKNSDM